MGEYDAMPMPMVGWSRMMKVKANADGIWRHRQGQSWRYQPAERQSYDYVADGVGSGGGPPVHRHGHYYLIWMMTAKKVRMKECEVVSDFGVGEIWRVMVVVGCCFPPFSPTLLPAFSPLHRQTFLPAISPSLLPAKIRGHTLSRKPATTTHHLPPQTQRLGSGCDLGP